MSESTITIYWKPVFDIVGNLVDHAFLLYDDGTIQHETGDAHSARWAV
jgi:hypothetical protein